jgi:hypothetical protein
MTRVKRASARVSDCFHMFTCQHLPAKPYGGATYFDWIWGQEPHMPCGEQAPWSREPYRCPAIGCVAAVLRSKLQMRATSLARGAEATSERGMGCTWTRHLDAPRGDWLSAANDWRRARKCGGTWGTIATVTIILEGMDLYRYSTSRMISRIHRV